MLDGSVLGSGSDMGMGGNDTYVRVSSVSPSSDEEGSGLSEPDRVPRREPLRGGSSSLDPASDVVTIDISPVKSPPGAEAVPPGWPRRRVCHPLLPLCVSQVQNYFTVAHRINVNLIRHHMSKSLFFWM